MQLDSLNDLFTSLLKDTYSAEVQLTQAIPNMAASVTSESLKQALENHFHQTEIHVSRLENIGRSWNIDLQGMNCKAMEGLVAEVEEIIDSLGEDSVKDAALIAAAQKIEHYEIAAYTTLVELTDLLKFADEMETLQSTLDEEQSANEELGSIVDSEVNPKAQEISEPA